MAFVVIWVVTVTGVFILGYSFGYQAGHGEGTQKGFQGALERSLEVERPLDLLRRILIPHRQD